MQHSGAFRNARPRPSSVCRLMPSTVRVLVSALGASLLFRPVARTTSSCANRAQGRQTLASLCAAWVRSPSSEQATSPSARTTTDTSTAKLLDTIPALCSLRYNVGSPGDSATMPIAQPTWGGRRGGPPRAGDVGVRGRRRAGLLRLLRGAAAIRPRANYSYNLGAWHIVALNSARPWRRVRRRSCGSRRTWPPPPRNERSPTASAGVLLRHVPPSAQRCCRCGTTVRRARRRVAELAHAELRAVRPADARSHPSTRQGIRRFIVGTGGLARGRSKHDRAQQPGARAGVRRLEFHASPGSYSWKFVRLLTSSRTRLGCVPQLAPPPPPPAALRPRRR